MRRTITALLASVASMAGAATAHAAPLPVLVADTNATPDSSGAVIRVGPNGAQSVVASNSRSTAAGGPALFAQPYDVDVGPDGSIWVMDDQGAGGIPRVVRVNPATGRQTEISTNAISAAAGGAQAFSLPTSIDVTAAGKVYVVDMNNAEDSPALRGGIIEVNPTTGRQTVLADNDISTSQLGEAAFARPLGAVPLPGGGFAAANSGVGGTGDPGVVMVSATGKLTTLSTNAISDAAGGEQPFGSPHQGIDRDSSGNLYVADIAAKVIKVEPSGRATALKSGAPFTCPSDLELASDGYLYVTDYCADAVFRFARTGGPVETISTNALSQTAGGGALFDTPIGLTVLTGSPPPAAPATPTPKPQCSDGRDNDGDRAVDQRDPGCTSATDNDEADETLNDLVLCGRRKISLVRADARGRKVALSGLVAAALGGSDVTLFARLGPKRVSLKTVRAKADGRFEATVKGPPKRLFNKARYFAVVAGSKSVALKLPQSLSSTRISEAGGTITLRGKIKRNLLGKKRNAVVVKRIVCGRYETVGEAKPRKSGAYTVRFKAPALGAAALYRAETKVLARPRSKRYVRQFARAIGISLTGQTG